MVIGQMEVLEIKPIENKKITVFMIEHFNPDCLNRVDKSLIRYLKEKDIDFATIDVKEECLATLHESILVESFNHIKVPYHVVEIPEYAKAALEEKITKKGEKIQALVEEYQILTDKESFKAQNLESWIKVLKDEVKEDEEFLSLKLRPEWIVKRILGLINSTKGKEIKFAHFAQPEVYNLMVDMFKELGMKVVLHELNLKIKSENLLKAEEIKQWKF